MIDQHHSRQARKAMPANYYRLSAADTLRASDLIWNWCDAEWLPADSPKWLFDSFSIPMEEMIAIRKASMEFGEVKKVYTVRKEDGQRRLF